jgi:hypothetical protein
MFEVTKDNYHTFLTFHGMNPEVAEWVVERWDNSEGYHTLMAVRIWVEASKFVIGVNK